MSGDRHVLLRDMAKEYGITRSAVRKFAQKCGIEIGKVRRLESKNQQEDAFTLSNAEAFRRAREDFVKPGQQTDATPSSVVSWDEFLGVALRKLPGEYWAILRDLVEEIEEERTNKEV